MTSTSDTSVTSIIKSDRIGRTHYSAAFKTEILAAFEKSSMSGQAFAKHYGIKYPTFASWRTRSRKQNPGSPKIPFMLAEIAPASSADQSGLVVELPNGAITRAHDITSVSLLAALIKALA